MVKNQLSASSIRKLIKKLTRRRRANPESLEMLSKIIFYTTSFLVLTANDLSASEENEGLRNSDLKKIFESFNLEKLFDKTQEDFLAEFVEN